MADPAVTPCPTDAWTKVATGVTTVTGRVIDESPSKYLWTYRVTLGAAPTDLTDAVPFKDLLSATFGAASDVYIYPVGQAGSVRIDT